MFSLSTSIDTLFVPVVNPVNYVATGLSYPQDFYLLQFLNCLVIVHLEALTVDASEKLFAEACVLAYSDLFPLVLISHITLAPKSCKFPRFIFRDILT